MSKIHIPTPLRQYVGKQAVVDAKGATVAEVLSNLSAAEHPDLRHHLYTEEGKLRAFVNVYLNDPRTSAICKRSHGSEGQRQHFHRAL